MSDEALRRACEEFLADLIVMTDFDVVVERNITRTIALIKQQRAAGWEEAAKEFDKLFMVTDHRLDGVRDFRVDKFFKWCEQQARR